MLYLRRWNLLVKLKLRRVIDMTIDKAIAKYKDITNTDAICPAHCNISCDKCLQESKQIVEWLEELKMLRELKDEHRKIGNIEGFNKGYNKAIDDFAEKMKQLGEVGEISVFGWNRIVDGIAEQLKAGDTNE